MPRLTALILSHNPARFPCLTHLQEATLAERIDERLTSPQDPQRLIGLLASWAWRRRRRWRKTASW